MRFSRAACAVVGLLVSSSFGIRIVPTGCQAAVIIFCLSSLSCSLFSCLQFACHSIQPVLPILFALIATPHHVCLAPSWQSVPLPLPIYLFTPKMTSSSTNRAAALRASTAAARNRRRQEPSVQPKLPPPPVRRGGRTSSWAGSQDTRKKKSCRGWGREEYSGWK